MSLRFLVAEDEPWVARSIQRALVPHGLVEVVQTAEAARERLASQTYDALVADVGLPDGSGFDLVAQAVSDEDGLLALVVSGRVDAERLAEAHALNVPYLLKPIDTTQLALFAVRVRKSLRPESRRGQIDRVVDDWTGRYALSEAQDQLLRMSAHGVSRLDLAVEREVLPGTIKKQVHELLRRTGDVTLESAVARLLREAVLPSPR